MNVSQGVTARALLVGAAAALGLLALSAALAFATAGGDSGFSAKQPNPTRIIAATCARGVWAFSFA